MNYRDDQIILSGILFYVVFGKMLPGGTQLPIWRLDGVILMALLHGGPVEFVYYLLHRALHHHYLYSRYHSHHHSSIVTEPITCMCFTDIWFINRTEKPPSPLFLFELAIARFYPHIWITHVRPSNIISITLLLFVPKTTYTQLLFLFKKKRTLRRYFKFPTQ